MAALDDALMKAGNDASAAMDLSDERRALQVTAPCCCAD